MPLNRSGDAEIRLLVFLRAFGIMRAVLRDLSGSDATPSVRRCNRVTATGAGTRHGGRQR